MLIAWLRSYICGIAVRNDIMSTDKLAHTELLADRSEMGGRRKNRTRLSNPHLNIQVDKHCLLLLTGKQSGDRLYARYHDVLECDTFLFDL